MVKNDTYIINVGKEQVEEDAFSITLLKEREFFNEQGSYETIAG